MRTWAPPARGTQTSCPCHVQARRPRACRPLHSPATTGAISAETALQVQREMEWFRIPPKVYFKGGSLEVALGDIRGKTRAMIVTDKNMFDMDYVSKVTRCLDAMQIQHQVFYHVEPNPTFAAVEAGLHEINDYQPDVIIALGGGSSLDAAKLIWLLYELPDASIEDLVSHTLEMLSRSMAVGPKLGRKATLVTIPTTSGTGAEVTPFAVVSDGKGNKFTVASHNLTPRMAIVDPQLVLSMPPQLTAEGGIHALGHAIESLTSRFNSVYTRGLSKQSATLIFQFLPRAYRDGASDYLAREKMHYAASIAGMAFSNTMLGIGASMASSVAGHYHLSHGLVLAPLLPLVILFNGAVSEQAAEDYEELADTLHLPAHPKGPTHALAHAVAELVQQVGLPSSLKEVLGGASSEARFKEALPLLVKQTMKDLHTGANPHAVTAADIEKILLDAWATEPHSKA